MEGIYFLISLVGVGIILYWFVQNDKVPPGEPTKGLLRMSVMEPSAGAGEQPAPSVARRGQTGDRTGVPNRPKPPEA